MVSSFLLSQAVAIITQKLITNAPRNIPPKNCDPNIQQTRPEIRKTIRALLATDQFPFLGPRSDSLYHQTSHCLKTDSICHVAFQKIPAKTIKNTHPNQAGPNIQKRLLTIRKTIRDTAITVQSPLVGP